MNRQLTRKALEARLRRKLAAQNKELHRCRPDELAREELGDYYLVDGHQVTDTNIDIVQLARDMGAIKPYEVMAA